MTSSYGLTIPYEIRRPAPDGTTFLVPNALMPPPIVNPYAKQKEVPSSLTVNVDLIAKGVILKKKNPKIQSTEAKEGPQETTKTTLPFPETNHNDDNCSSHDPQNASHIHTFSYNESRIDPIPEVGNNSNLTQELMSRNLSFRSAEILFVAEIVAQATSFDAQATSGVPKSLRTTGVVVQSVKTNHAVHFLLRDASDHTAPSMEARSIHPNTPSLMELEHMYQQHPHRLIRVQAPLDQARDVTLPGTLVMVMGEWRTRGSADPTAGNATPTAKESFLQARIVRSAEGTHMELYRQAILARRQYLEQERATFVNHTVSRP